MQQTSLSVTARRVPLWAHSTLEKKVIAVARLAKYGEHINDHQIAINETLAREGLLLNVTDMADLGSAIKALQSGEVELKPWHNDNPTAIVDVIDEFIRENAL